MGMMMSKLVPWFLYCSLECCRGVAQLNLWLVRDRTMESLFYVLLGIKTSKNQFLCFSGMPIPVSLTNEQLLID